MKYSKPVRIRSVYPNQPEVISSFIFNFNSKVNEKDCEFDGVRMRFLMSYKSVHGGFY